MQGKSVSYNYVPDKGSHQNSSVLGAVFWEARLARLTRSDNFRSKNDCLYGRDLLERGEISLTGMKISSYKHSQAGWPGCQDV